jgi:hypothetical protein
VAIVNSVAEAKNANAGQIAPAGAVILHDNLNSDQTAGASQTTEPLCVWAWNSVELKNESRK